MANNSNGISQYLVLDSLAQGSKYGLEIIEYVSAKSGGNIIMKKPTLYSCLTRLEKKGLVSSSFWGESDMGGKRHYYNITSSGKQALETLAKEFENADFAEELSDNLSEESKDDAVFVTERLEDTKTSSQIAQTEEEFQPSSPVVLQQDNIFDLVNQEEQPVTPATQPPKEEVVENQIDLFSFQENLPKEEEYTQKMEYYQSILEAEPVEAEQKNDAKFLTPNERLTSEQEKQNKMLYDTSSELKKYRKRKSFSENQIEMAVSYETEAEQEFQRSRIEQLKKSMLSARQNQFENLGEQPEETYSTAQFTPVQQNVQNSSIEEEILDDAVFITSPRMEEIPTQKKIAPPNIDVVVTDGSLPAPKRNANLEPTYKDMMAKLFENKKEKEVATPTEQYVQVEEAPQAVDFSDFDSLKKYYQGHGIELKEYHKTSVQRNHNTYFLNFISSVMLLALSGIGCAVIFGILSGLNLLSASTNFLFYTVPILFFVYCILTFVRDRVYVSKKAHFKYNSVVNWAIFLLSCVVVLVANVIAGMQYEIVAQYLTSLIVPIYALCLAFPINYYIRKLLYKKYAK